MVADEDCGRVAPRQLVVHAVQRELADDETVDALLGELAQIIAAMRLPVPTGNVGVVDERLETGLLEAVLRGLDDLGIERVSDIGDEHCDHVGAAGAQTLGLRVGRIAELVDGGSDALAQLLGHAVGVIDHVRHGGAGDACPLGDL